MLRRESAGLLKLEEEHLLVEAVEGELLLVKLHVGEC